MCEKALHALSPLFHTRKRSIDYVIKLQLSLGPRTCDFVNTSWSSRTHSLPVREPCVQSIVQQRLDGLAACHEESALGSVAQTDHSNQGLHVQIHNR